MRKSFIAVIVLFIGIGVAVTYISTAKKQTVFVCQPEEERCEEHLRKDITNSDKIGCIVLLDTKTELCGGAYAFPRAQVEGEATRDCRAKGGTLSSPKPGFYHCSKNGQTLEWWPFAAGWKKI